jgi:hypothetical protein
VGDNSSGEGVVVTIVSASPTLTTTPNPTSATLGTAPVTLKDTATLSGGINPTGTITFKLYNGSATLVDTETVTVAGNGTYSTPTGYTLRTTAVAGTYQWDATYSGNTTNNAVSDNGATNERVTVRSPCRSGLTAYFLSATSHSGNFSGIFCVNAAGIGSYTQRGVGGQGTIEVVGGNTWISANGTDLALTGRTNGTSSAFVELAPAPSKTGTFTLS